MSKGSRNTQKARERLARIRAEQARRRRRRIGAASTAAAAAVIAAVVGISLSVTSSSSGATAPGPSLAPLSTVGTLQPAPSPGAPGAESVPVPAEAPLAGLATSATGQPVAQISCQVGEQTVFHIHAHLTIFVNGQARQVPAAIGIPGAQAQQTPYGPFIAAGTCFYWLHTHAADGIIHIESPIQRTYTLGDFFDIWGQLLGPGQVGPATGHVIALYNGRVYEGNPRDIPLTAHAQIQLDIGTPLIAPQHITFPAGL
ncbi:MAG: hypothetical protein JO132_10615 [Streptosporangiaceae bacterium]|nr:hypothetical protein [Streptosporangiaceae bacterium]